MVIIVSFDVGKTLIDYYYLNYIWNEVIPKLYAKKNSLEYREAKSQVLKKYNEIGTSDIRWYLPEYWFTRFKLDEDPIEIFSSNIDKIRFYPEVESVIFEISQKHDLIIASGIPTNLIEVIMKEFDDCFKHIFSPVSDLYQVRKTPKFYKMICNALEVNPSKIIHVGDDYLYDYIIPKKIGMKSILLDRKQERKEDDVIKNLKELHKLIK